MSLSRQDVDHVASLARLGLSDDEKETLRDQLSSILEHIAVLNAIDTESIPPTAQVIALQNVLRDDEIRPSLSQEQVLQNAPRSRDGFFEVRAVMASGSDGESA
ncbi:MAG TPA: Asp-tRNA(Asn)/Glu-tRNA(Gln) amidotransferase subunit GatC [Thermomicrobiales bacterium]|nr:Asp-tRNA(Asn)/Glu-tRNA(Gln) amidotransferase subunit GatC [Thermomicrobiales bacterium]